MIDYLQKGQTINGTYHASLLRQFRENIRVKHCRKLKGVLFHQDNAPAHTSVNAMAAINDCGFELIQHPLTRLILLYQTHSFPKLKRPFLVLNFSQMMTSYMQWRSFWTVKKSGIEAHQHRWQKCTDIEEDYVEKLYNMSPKSKIFTSKAHNFSISPLIVLIFI